MRFQLPQYGEYGLDRDLLKHIYDYVDGTGPTSQSIRDAILNDALASSAWQRNEASADNAAQRQVETSRELRQTQFQDTVSSAQAAGINPVMALGYGVSSPASAPQATSPAGSTSSGAPRATLDSILNSIFAVQRFQLNRAQIGVAKAERNVMEQQATNIAADTQVKKNTASNLEENTRGLRLSNDFLDQTFAARKESVNLQNNLTYEQVRSTRKAIDVADEQINLMIKQETSEERRQVLLSAQAILARANAYQIHAVTPYMQLELQARTDQERASAQALVVSASYQQGLISAGMIEAEVRRSNASASSEEVQSEVLRVEKELKQYQDDVNHGRISKIAEGSDTVVGGLFATVKTAVDLVKP